MPAGSNVVDQARDLIEKRLSELDDERQKLEGALRDLGGRRGPGRPRGSGGGRKRRRRRGGTRSEQALKIIQENPGITPSQIAEQLGIQPNYMYRVMNELQKDKLVKKRGRGYFAR
ncbi:MAG: winged helix-turn-helix domain-containing protein [Solirubrobacterales bacterium]